MLDSLANILDSSPIFLSGSTGECCPVVLDEESK